MADSFPCTVVTPTASLFDDQVVYASVPLEDGLMGVQSGRQPVLAPLGLGELRVDFAGSSGGSRSYMIDGGIMQMSDSKLTILAERALPAEEISASDAAAELAEAEARTVAPDAEHPSLEQARINHERARARLKIRLANASKRSGI